VADLLAVSDARERVLAEVRPLAAQPVALEEALGRVLADDVRSAEAVPPFDSSAMDGYAVVAGPGAELPVVGESRAGRPSGQQLEPGQAMVISTGAVVPRGADAVVPVELTERVDGRVRVPDTAPGLNVRRAGEDVERGDLVVEAGTVLGAAELGVLASLGFARAMCARRPVVAVLTTGDELVEIGSPLAPGQIRNSNAVTLGALAAQAGAQVLRPRLIRDDLDSTVAALGRALASADVVCVSGGVSVGPHDHVKPALAALGVEERFWGVSLKPGKPTWFGVRAPGTLVFGLPGNPVSAMVTFHLFARPALRALAGAEPGDTRATAVLDAPVRRTPSREQVIRCRLHAGGDGWHVEPTKRQDSHVLTSMVGARAFALVPAGNGELDAGSRVEIELLA
jgi:molybdopterin molybdotransferase